MLRKAFESLNAFKRMEPNMEDIQNILDVLNDLLNQINLEAKIVDKEEQMQKVALRVWNGETTIRVELDKGVNDFMLANELAKDFALEMGLVVGNFVSSGVTKWITTVQLFSYRTKDHREKMRDVKNKAFAMREARISNREKRLTK